jgi:hypothetical protein
LFPSRRRLDDDNDMAALLLALPPVCRQGLAGDGPNAVGGAHACRRDDDEGNPVFRKKRIKCSSIICLVQDTYAPIEGREPLLLKTRCWPPSSA